MSEKDAATKEFMQDKEIFADAFNFLIYGGEPVIKPEQLKPLDTTALTLPFGEDGKSVSVQKYRDVLKLVTAMEDGNAAYLLLGVENQSEIHYAMPVRTMLYDALQYASQVSETAKAHKSGKDDAETRGEYLSGFYKSDKLLPVITLTIYFGADEWDAPTCLHEMFPETDPRLLKYVADYPIHLLTPAGIRDEDFVRFRSEFGLAFKFLKYSKDKNRLGSRRRRCRIPLPIVGNVQHAEHRRQYGTEI